MEYSWEIREQAEELYIIDGLTFDQVHGAVSVSVSQLKRWANAAEPTWKERRREFRRAQTSIRHDVVMAKAKLIKDVVASLDPQKAYAFTSLVTATKSTDKNGAASAPAAAIATRSIKTPQDAVDALQEVVAKKINTMLTQPGELSFAAIKDTKQAMEMSDQLTAKYTPGAEKTAKPAGLSDDAADVIRKQILGLGA